MNARCDRRERPQDREPAATGEPLLRMLYLVTHCGSGRQAYVLGPSLEAVAEACALVFGEQKEGALSIVELAGGPGGPDLLVHLSALPPEDEE